MSTLRWSARWPYLVAVTAFAALVLVGALGVLAWGGSSADEVPATDPQVEHCLAAGGEPVGSGDELVCLIDPVTVERTPGTDGG